MDKQTQSLDTEAETAAPSTLPILVRAQYIKDLSFENPNPIKAFSTTNEEQPHISVNVQVKAHNLGENNFEVVLEFSIDATHEKEKFFLAELSYAALVTIGNVPEEQIPFLVVIECPHLLFPFARNILADVIREGGYPPIYLSPVDFAHLYHQKTQQHQTLN